MTTALTIGLSASYWASAASSTSTGESSRLRMRATCSTAGRKAISDGSMATPSIGSLPGLAADVKRPGLLREYQVSDPTAFAVEPGQAPGSTPV